MVTTAAGQRVLGVGWGVFIIATVWSLALVLSILFYRVRALVSLVFTSSAVILSAIFLALPRASDDEEDEESLQYYLYNKTSRLFEPVSILK